MNEMDVRPRRMAIMGEWRCWAQFSRQIQKKWPTRFSVDNMTCATCPISVKKAMLRVDGVKSVEIDFGTKTAEVVYDPAITSPETIAAASAGVGYPAVQTS